MTPAPTGGEYVICDKCLTSTALVYGIKEDPKPLLAERWNTRATDTLLDEMAGALEFILHEILYDYDGPTGATIKVLQAEQVLQKYRERKEL